MKRINITHDDDVSPEKAMEVVSIVIGKGKISDAVIRGEEVAHYCWATVFNSGLVVGVRRKKNYFSPDSFHVYRDTK